MSITPCIRLGCFRFGLFAVLAPAVGWSQVVLASADLTAVAFPSVQVESTLADTGASQSGGDLFLDGALTGIWLSKGDLSDLTEPFADFFLTADGQTASPSGDRWRYEDGGQICIGASCAFDMTAGELLVGTFHSMQMRDAGDGNVTIFANLEFTGGSLISGIDFGQIFGVLSAVPDPQGDFSGVEFVARVGSVNAIPLPASAWLLVGGLPLLARVRRSG